jgi:hypothetical protein
MDWATFWAIFYKTHPVTLVAATESLGAIILIFGHL